jgi:hypothetical protein
VPDARHRRQRARKSFGFQHKSKNFALNFFAQTAYQTPRRSRFKSAAFATFTQIPLVETGIEVKECGTRVVSRDDEHGRFV